MDSKTTIRSLFNSTSQIFVPNYQRAYSWKAGQNSKKDAQIDQFWNDLYEQDPDKKYYLGHFLFENVADSEDYFVIDGQQRLTTIVIFMSALIRVCESRALNELGNTSLKEIGETYLKRYDRQKFSTVTGDAAYFLQRIIQRDLDTSCPDNRKSAHNIKDAVDFFEQKMASETEEKLTQMFETLHFARATTFVLDGPDAKLTATQIFAFQNDRGKELTTLEKLKAFLMHQMYRSSTNTDSIAVEEDIRIVENAFSGIYSAAEQIKENNEDTVLNWHCHAFLSGYTDALSSIKEKLKQATDKRNWMIRFVSDLKVSFMEMVKIEQAANSYNSLIADICYLDKYNAMPLLLKLAHYGKLELTGYDSPALKLIEKILFKMTFTIGQYRTNSLIETAKKFSMDNFDSYLLPRLKECAENGFQHYWNFTGDCRRYFEDNNYHYNTKIKYILYLYENNLRAERKIPALPISECSNIFRERILENTLDHITPMNPDFREYSENFKADYLCNIGNLSLLTWSNNSSKNNENPASERCSEKYNSVYLAQKEIYDVLVHCKDKGKLWDKEEISARRGKILKFIFNEWGLGSSETIKVLPDKL